MRKLIPWIAAFIILTIIFGSLYGAVQQSLRLNANDPQIQMAEDTAYFLDNGGSVANAVNGGGGVNLNASLSPFIIIYNKSGHMVTSSGYIVGTFPDIPYGVLTHATPGHYNAVTWQPQPGLRFATVAVAAKNYYVLTGRSLREVEKREDLVMRDVAFGWVVSVFFLSCAYLAMSRSRAKKK